MNIKKSKIAAILLLSIMFFSCVRKKDKYITPTYNKTETYQVNQYHEVEIVRVRDCEYVLISTRWGTDIEHYEGCENPKHYKKIN